MQQYYYCNPALPLCLCITCSIEGHWLKRLLSSTRSSHRAAELGHVLAIGLSTTRYRSNKYSHHE
eukprot:scaffold158949_cov17-Tisochrysis_lutea.AAC.1